MATNAQITVNSVPGSNDDVALNVVVALANVNAGGELTYEWTLVSQPTGSPAAVLSSTSNPTCTFTPNKEGSYLIKLVVNKTLADEKTNQVIVAVRELQTRNRIPAAGETTENNATTGWANTAVDQVLRRVTQLTDAGAISAVAAESLSAGQLVYVSASAQIATGLPGARYVPKVSAALATTQSKVTGFIGLFVSTAAGAASASTDDVVRVLGTGLWRNVTLGGAAAVSDVVYVADTGYLSLTAGTYSRVVGNIAQVNGGGSYDVFVNAGGAGGGTVANATASTLGIVQLAGGLGGGGPATAPTLNVDPANVGGGTLPLNRGGTGNNTVPAAGRVPYSNGASFSYSPAGTATQVYKGGTAPGFSALNLATDVTGTLPNTAQQAQTMGGDVTGTTAAATVAKLQGFAVDATTPEVGQTLVWDGAKYVPSSTSQGGGGGGGVLYYFNSLTAGQAPITGLNAAVKKMDVVDQATINTLTNAAVGSAGYSYVASFVTDQLVPGATSIPSGIWDFGVWATTNALANEAKIRASLYKYDGSTATLIAQSLGVYISNPASTEEYSLSITISGGTTLLATDRLMILFEAQVDSGTHSVTMSFGGATPSHVHSTMPSVTGTGVVKVIGGVLQSPATPVSLTADVSGILPVANGGTGNSATPTSGGVAYGDATGKIATTSALTQNAVLVGGGAGNGPAALSSLGSAGQVLTSQGAGLPPIWSPSSGGGGGGGTSPSTISVVVAASGTVNYDVLTTDYVILVRAAVGASVNVRLPTIGATGAGAYGRTYIIKNQGAGTVSIASQAGEYVDGASSVALMPIFSSMTVMSTDSAGLGWAVL